MYIVRVVCTLLLLLVRQCVIVPYFLEMSSKIINVLKTIIKILYMYKKDHTTIHSFSVYRL